MTIETIVLALAALCHKPGPFPTAGEMAQLAPPQVPAITRDDKGRIYFAAGTRKGDMRPLGIRCEDVRPERKLDDAVVWTPRS